MVTPTQLSKITVSIWSRQLTDLSAGSHEPSSNLTNTFATLLPIVDYTGSLALSQHVVTHTQLFKITVSFGSVNSLISLPGAMSHASIPAEVRAAREFPEDLIRISIGIESAVDLIADLRRALGSYSAAAATVTEKPACAPAAAAEGMTKL